MITIGKAVNAILKGNVGITGVVGEKIYPIVAPEGTQFPFILYQVMGEREYYTKDGPSHTISVIKVTVLTEEFMQNINIMNLVYGALNWYRGIIAGINIVDSRVTGFNEDQGEGAYMKEITFEIKCR